MRRLWHVVVAGVISTQIVTNLDMKAPPSDLVDPGYQIIARNSGILSSEKCRGLLIIFDLHTFRITRMC